MTCQTVAFNSPWILQIYKLRQQVLRAPLGLNLFDEDLLSEKDEVFFLAYEKEMALSCLQLRIQENKILKLRQMATRQNAQSKGYGRKLVEFAEEWGRKNDYQNIELHARKVAQGFYENLGYKKVGEEFLEVEIPHYKMVKNLG
jgi:predicted GNAT family N-acyltransferase